MKKLLVPIKLFAFSCLTLLFGLSSAFADYPSTVLADGPLVYFRLNDGVTSPAFDYATNSGTIGSAGFGFYTGATHPVSGALIGLPGNTAAGIPNANNGGLARVRIPYVADLNPNGAFSVEFWAKPSKTSDLGCAAASVDFSAATRFGWLIYQGDSGLSAGNGWFFRLYHSAGNTPVSVNLAISTNHWYHIVGTFDGTSTIKLYVDGVPVGTNTLGGSFTPNTNPTIPMSFGARADGVAGAFGWGGSMDEAAFYTNVLSDADVLSHYQNGTNATPGTPYSSLVLAKSPPLYLRLSEPTKVFPTAANLGSLGASGNGNYYGGVTNGAGPQPAAFPIFEANNAAAALDGASGNVQFPQVGNFTNSSLTSVKEATFVCWVKMNALQGEYKGLLAMRPLSSGLYLNTDSSLNYSWNDDGATYGFNSALIPSTSGEWNLAAVVIQPTQAVFYLGSPSGGFTSVTNPVTHSPADFTSGPFAIGRDVNFGGAGRYFNGSIDEAAIFTRALSDARIRTYFLTAIDDQNAPVLASDPPTVSPSGTIYATSTFSITADAYGASPTFQWRKGGINVGTGPVYTKSNAAVSDGGNYDVIISNSHGSVTSSIVSITVNPAVPPTITQQPASRSAYAGGNASFSVAATGTPPFTYQWKHAGTNIPGATNATLFVSGVDATKTGNYLVTVTDVAGPLDSATAVLSIRTPAANSFEAAVVAAAPIAYWRLDESSGLTAFDLMGGHDGTYYGGITHIAGGLSGDSDGAANFNGVDAYVGTGTGLLNGLTRFSLTGWVRRSGAEADRTGLFGQNDNVEFGYISDQDIQFWDNVLASPIDAANTLDNGVWGMITLTSDGTNRVIYINGQPAASGTARTTPMTNNFPFNIGGGGIFDNIVANSNSFAGDLDDVAVYDKALTADQVANLYAVGAFGTTTPPQIVTQPAPYTAAAGSTATFTVVANGSVPLAYQWKKDGTPVPGATKSAFAISNVYFTDAGNYSVQVTNNNGLTNSAPAALTVLPVPSYANQTNGLVLHLKFDGTFADSSGRTNDAVAPSTAPGFISGRIGQGVNINTTPGLNYLTVDDPNSDFVFYETNSFTVGFWLSFTAGFNDTPIIGNANNSTYQPGWVITEDTNQFEWTLNGLAGAGSVNADPVGGPLINNGAWHHLVLSVNRDTQTASSYVDGNLIDKRSIKGVGSLATGYTMTIGQDPTGSYGNANFNLDDLGIWRRALSDYEVLSVYNAAAVANESFDVYGPIKVYVKQVGTNIDVNWQSGTLLQSATVNGTYTPVAGATPPFYRTTASGPAKFFRVQQ